MFGWFRKMFKPETARKGPVGFDFDIEIDAPPERIYALIDFADPANAKRELGHSVTQVSTDPETWKLVINQMPDAAFFNTVTEAKAPTLYAYRCEAEPQQGAMVWDVERWTIEPRESAPTLVRLIVEAQFVEDMPFEEHYHHVAMMATGCNNALEKLKLHAEQGVAAVRAVEEQQFA